MTSKILNAAEIFAAPDLKTIEIDVPEWGGAIRVREFDLTAREAFAAFCEKNEGRGVLSYVLSLSAVDESGAPVFGKGAAEALAKKNPQVMERIAREIMVLNGLAPAAVEQAEKN